MSKREILIAREAFTRGVRHVAGWLHSDPSPAAKAIYPLVETAPRVVRDPEDEDFEWSARNGVLSKRNIRARSGPASAWHCCTGVDGFAPTAARVKLWADLLANPTVTQPVSDETETL